MESDSDVIHGGNVLSLLDLFQAGDCYSGKAQCDNQSVASSFVRLFLPVADVTLLFLLLDTGVSLFITYRQCSTSATRERA